MSSTWIDFIALFDNSDRCEAVYQALLAARVGGDLGRWNTELEKNGVKDIDDDDDWSSDLLQREDCVLTGEIQGSASSEPREWLSAFAQLGATGIAAKAFFDQVGVSEKLWLINGKRASKAKLFEVLTSRSPACALVVAIEQRDLKQVQKLLEEGANPNTRVFGRPAIVAASESGPQGIVKALVQAGADVNAHDRDASSLGLSERGGTALHDVVGSVTMVRFLLSAGADANARNAKGETPLHLAAIDAVNESVFRALLKAGAEIDARDDRGLTPLIALFRGRGDQNYVVNMKKFLISRGADLEARDAHGGNAVWYATGSGFESLLLADGLTLEIPDDAYVGELYQDLCTAIHVCDAEAFAGLVDRVGELSLEEAHTLLEGAVLQYRVEIVQALVERGVDVNRRNRQGYTVFQMEKICRERSQRESSKEVLRVLRRYGKQAREEERRQTSAAMSFYEEYVKILSKATTIEDLEPYRTAEARPLSDKVLPYLHKLHTAVPIQRVEGGLDKVKIYRGRDSHPGLDITLVKKAGKWKVAMENVVS